MALNVNGLEGKEIADDYTRKSVPEGRWRDTWEVCKGAFGKLVILNLIILVCFMPAVAIFYVRSAYIAGLGTVYPLNPGITFPHDPDVQGMAQGLVLSSDVMFYGLMIIAGFIASIGISGAAYTIRRLLNTHGEFRFKSFLHGIKTGYLKTVLPVTVFLLFLYGTVLVGDWKDVVLATGGNGAGAITAYVFAIIACVFAGIYGGWLFAVGTNYRVGFGSLLKNSFIMMLGTPLQTVIIAGVALIPVWILLIGGFFVWIAFAFFIALGFVFILTCWVSFSQWTFDLFITPNIKVEQSKVKVNKTEKELAQEKAEEERRIAGELLAAGRSELIARPIMPIAAGQAVNTFGRTYSRALLAEAEKERQKLCEDISAYEKAHENDAVYKEYNKLFAEREKALKVDDKKGKKKKVSAANLLK